MQHLHLLIAILLQGWTNIKASDFNIPILIYVVWLNSSCKFNKHRKKIETNIFIIAFKFYLNKFSIVIKSRCKASSIRKKTTSYQRYSQGNAEIFDKTFSFPTWTSYIKSINLSRLVHRAISFILYKNNIYIVRKRYLALK